MRIEATDLYVSSRAICRIGLEVFPLASLGFLVSPDIAKVRCERKRTYKCEMDQAPMQSIEGKRTARKKRDRKEECGGRSKLDGERSRKV